GNDRKRQQQGIQRIAGAPPEFFRNCRLAFARNEVGPEALQAGLGLGFRKTFWTGSQSCADLVGTKAADRRELVVAIQRIDIGTIAALEWIRQDVRARYRGSEFALHGPPHPVRSHGSAPSDPLQRGWSSSVEVSA